MSATDEHVVAKAGEIDVSTTLRIRALLLRQAIRLRTLYPYELNGYTRPIGEVGIRDAQTKAATPSLLPAPVILKAAEPKFVAHTLDFRVTAAPNALAGLTGAHPAQKFWTWIEDYLLLLLGAPFLQGSIAGLWTWVDWCRDGAPSRCEYGTQLEEHMHSALYERDRSFEKGCRRQRLGEETEGGKGGYGVIHCLSERCFGDFIGEDRAKLNRTINQTTREEAFEDQAHEAGRRGTCFFKFSHRIVRATTYHDQVIMASGCYWSICCLIRSRSCWK